MDRHQRDGLLLLLLAALGYSFLPILTKIAYTAGLEPLDLLGWRFVVATPCVWLLLLLRNPAEIRAPLPRLPLLLMGVLFFGVAVFAFLALDLIPASVYTVLLYAYPAFVALFSLLAGERLSGQGWAALGLTLVGVVLTVPDVGNELSRSDPVGMLLALLNGASYAVYIVISSRLLKGVTSLQTASALSITGSLLGYGIAILFIGVRVPQGGEAWGSIIALAVFSTVVPIFAFYAGLHKLGAPRAAILSTIEPVLVLIWAFVLLGERLQPIQLVGGAFILSSAILLQLRRQPARPLERVPVGD